MPKLTVEIETLDPTSDPRVQVWIDDMRIGYLQEVRFNFVAGKSPSIELTQITPPEHGRAQDLRFLARLLPWAELYTQRSPEGGRQLIHRPLGSVVRSLWKRLRER